MHEVAHRACPAGKTFDPSRVTPGLALPPPRASGRGQRGRGRRLEEHHSAAEEGGGWEEDYLAEYLDDPVFGDYAA